MMTETTPTYGTTYRNQTDIMGRRGVLLLALRTRTQTAIALDLGVDNSAISHMRAGRRAITDTTMLKLARAYPELQALVIAALGLAATPTTNETEKAQ